MLTRSRLLEILVFILGFAILFDTRVQLAAVAYDVVVWQPIDEPEPCCASEAVEGLFPCVRGLRRL